jgi:hypothetical protein
MAEETAPEFYQFHVCIRQIRPMIGWRFLVRGESALSDLPDVIQVALCSASVVHPP